MDRKALPRYFEGFKFLRLSDLPENQLSMFSSWTDVQIAKNIPSSFQVEEEADIVKYEDYDFWFDYHYLTLQNMDELI